jgi:chromosome segregation ATPase
MEALKSTEETSFEYDARLKNIQEKLKELKKPIHINNGGLENTLEMYKKLAEELSSLKIDSQGKQIRDNSQRYLSKLDEVISIVEHQIIQTTEIISIYEQYKTAVSIITEEISNISTEMTKFDHINEPLDTGEHESFDVNLLNFRVPRYLMVH